MATLKNLGDELKRIFSGVNNAMPYSWAQNQNNPYVRGATAAVKEVGSFIPQIGQGIVGAITSPAIKYLGAAEAQKAANQSLLLQQQAKALQQGGDKQKARLLMDQAQAYGRAGQSYEKPLQNMYNKQALASGTGGVKSLLTASGLGVGLPTLLGTAGFGGLIGGGIAKLTGQDVATAVGQGIGSAPRLSGLNKLTGPILDKALGSVVKTPINPSLLQKLAGGVRNTSLKSLTSGLFNVGEDNLYTLGTEGRLPSLGENALSFGIGASSPIAGSLLRGKQDLTKYDSGVVKQLRDIFGQWAEGQTPQKPPKMPKAQWEFQLKFNDKYGRNPYTPVYNEDLRNSFRIEAEKRAGMTARPVGFDKLPPNKFEVENGVRSVTTPSVVGGKAPVPMQNQQIPKVGIEPIKPVNLGQASDPRVGQQKPLGQESQLPQLKVDQPTVQKSSSGNIIPQPVKVEPQQLNVNNLNLDTAQKQEIISMQANQLKTKLGDKQVMDLATNLGIDTKSHTVDETAKKIAEQLNLRRNVVTLEGELTTMRQAGASQDQIIAKLKEIDSASRISAEQGTDIARQLRARRIMANELDTPMQRVFKLLQNAGVNPEKYLKEASTVDFNNPAQVVEFYRKLVPAKAGDWLDQLRYNSMLSSPNTHINNAFSNLGNTAIVAPIEKTLTGTLDFLSSPFRGGKRNQFALEGPAYSAGYISSLGKAASKFADVMRGVKQSENLDTKYIPVATTGIKGVAAKALDLPMRLLEASDQFFTTLTAGGEEAALKLRQSRGVDVGDIQGTAKDNAAYRLFRSELNDPKQGALLSGIDHLTGLIMRARNDKSWVGTVAKFTVPFVKTPMNILKQMVEYSPAGIATIPGAMNKTEQLSKAIMGTSAALGAAMLLGSGRTTWAEPTDAKKKAAFRAAGMQPYSVKIGDNWVSYSKLPPVLAANLALVSAIHDGIENKRLDDSAVDSILSGVSKWGNFFADQSYLKQMGDLVAAVKGDPEKITSYFSNYPQQLVPFRALSGWVARIIDPYQRKVNTDASVLDKQMQQLMMNIPGVSQNVPARMDQNGAPIENQNRVLNAFSPMRITTEKPQAKSEYDTLVAKAKETRMENDLRDRVKGSKDVVQSGNKVAFMGSDGKTHVIDTSFQPTPPELTGQTELDKKAISKFNGEITSKANDVYDLYKAGKITEQEAEKALTDLKSLKAKTGSGKLKKITFKKSAIKPIKITLPKARKIATMKLKKPPKAKLAKFKAKTALKITKLKPIQAKKLKGLSAGARLV